MSLELQKFVDGIQTPTTKFSVKELREREEFWRAMWSWIDDEVKAFCLRVGSTVRLVRRDYKSSVGELGQVHFAPTSVELTVYEKVYNYNDGKYYYEDKIIKIPFGAIAWHEFVTSQTAAEEAEKFEVESIPETEEVG